MSGELKYGMHIKLEAKSPLPGPDGVLASKPLSIGLYAKHNLVCLGSPDRPEGATFTLVSTGNNSGDTVLYGDKVILVDIVTGNVLNYIKIGTWTSGYVSLAAKNQPGELHVVFQGSGKKVGTPILIDDVKSSFRVTISVCSAKDNKVPLTPITIQKKQSSSVLGGYVMRDESGQHVQFSLVYVEPEYVADKIASIGTSLSIPVSPSIPSRQSMTTGVSLFASPSLQSERTSFSTQHDNDNILRYGDKIKLYATSPYHKENNIDGGYVGIYLKHKLASIGPLQQSEDISQFEVSEFTIKPTGKSKEGDILRYASTLTLVDQYGNIWNNKFTGTWGNGFITSLHGKDSHEREGSAELDISFQPPSHSLLGYPIHADDSHINIDIEKSYRTTSKYNTRLRVFKKKSSQLVGGYLICLPNYGKPVTFKIERTSQTQSQGTSESTAPQKQNNQDQAKLHETLEIKHQRKQRRLQRQKQKVEYEKKLELYKKKSQEYAQILNDKIKNRRDLTRTPDRLRHMFKFLSLLFISISVSQYIELNSTLSHAKLIIYLILSCLSIVCGFSKFLKTPNEKNSLIDPVLIRPEPPILEEIDESDDDTESDLSENDVNDELGNRDGSDDEDEKKDEEDKDVINVDTENACTTNTKQPVGYQDWETVPLPDRYIRAEKGNEVTARARFVKTMRWFDDNKLWTILDRPHPLYRFIKKTTHHFFAGRGKNGNCVYYERPKSVKMDILQKANVDFPDLLYHFIYITEYLYQVLDTNPDAKCFSVVDADGVGLGDLSGSVADYMKQIAYLTGTHYPERSFAIFVLNAPFSFRLVWNIVKGFVDPVTQQKTHIMGGVKDYLPRLRTLVDDDQIPPSYGGSSSFVPTLVDGIDYPESSMEPQFNHIAYSPVSQEEEDLLAISDKANWQYIKEHPDEIIPRPYLLRTTREQEDAHQQQLASSNSN